MKTTIAVLLCAALVPTFTAKNTPEEPVRWQAESYLNGQVVAIRHLSLKEGVDPDEVDRFLASEWNPAARNIFPGAREFFVKGERGQRVGEYIHVYVFESRRSRDFYWPEPGTSTPAAEAAMMAADTTLFNKLNAKLDEYFEPGWGEEYTDYVELSR